MENRLKKQLLETKMNNSVFGEAVAKWFVADLRNKPLNEYDIFTLEDFFARNNYDILVGDLLICNKKGEKVMSQSSLGFKNLKKFLLEQGFDYTDWVLLLPRDEVEFRKYISNLSSEDLKKLPYRKVCGMKQKSIVTKVIDEYLKAKFKGEFKDDDTPCIITLGHFLTFDEEDMVILTFEKKLSVPMVSAIRAAFKIAREKLTALKKFGPEEGFMRIRPSKTTLAGSRLIEQKEEGQLSLFPLAGPSNKVKVTHSISDNDAQAIAS